MQSGLCLAVLHHHKLSVFSVISGGGGGTASFFKLSRLFEHVFANTGAHFSAFNMTYGPFGSGGGGGGAAAALATGSSSAPRDAICVQSLDGQLAVFEQVCGPLHCALSAAPGASLLAPFCGRRRSGSPSAALWTAACCPGLSPTWPGRTPSSRPRPRCCWTRTGAGVRGGRGVEGCHALRSSRPLPASRYAALASAWSSDAAPHQARQREKPPPRALHTLHTRALPSALCRD